MSRFIIFLGMCIFMTIIISPSTAQNVDEDAIVTFTREFYSALGSKESDTEVVNDFKGRYATLLLTNPDAYKLLYQLYTIRVEDLNIASAHLERYADVLQQLHQSLD